jgi:hypothetical protein
MARSVFPSALVALALTIAGCQPGTATKPAPAATAATTTKAPAGDHDHAGHDHGDHDHADHDHAAAAKGKPAAEADAEHHHEHPDSLAGLAAEVEKLAGVVSAAMAEGVREKADGPLHEIGHLLEDVEHLAKEAKLAPEVEAAVTKAGSDLFDAFDALDRAVHGGDDLAKAWEGKAEGIAAAMKVLKDAGGK